MNTFHAMYGNWRRAREEVSLPKGALMIDPSDVELAAMRRCLRYFGEAAQSIGFDKPLGEYSEAQALSVIDAIVTGYSQAMADHHEATRFPPVHGMALAADPMLGVTAQPFADMPDDLPWEQPVASAASESRRVK
jgi:hypothetical protein